VVQNLCDTEVLWYRSSVTEIFCYKISLVRKFLWCESFSHVEIFGTDVFWYGIFVIRKFFDAEFFVRTFCGSEVL